MEGFGEDEIESILWIGREVYGAHLNISQMPFSPHKSNSLQDSTLEGQ